jgi:hypothetical protein
MISFRFHVVSITAIFLAIAIGVVVGSTYVDGAVVDGLRSRIRTVEGNVSDARDENARLEGELDDAREYIGASADFAVTDRLTDVPVMVVAARGVDEAAVEQTVALARRAGGAVPGIVWLEPSWAAESDEELDTLGSIVDASASDDREDLWAEAWQRIADELAAEETAERAPDDGVGDVGSGTGGGSVLGDLEAAGLITVDSLDDDTVSVTDLEGAAPRMLFITGTRALEEIVPVVPIAVEASVGGGLVTVLADVHVVADEAPDRGEVVSASLEDSVLEAIVVVDHADLEEGQVASVLALNSAAEGQVGVRYGFGAGADAVLPEWTAP